MSEIDEEFKKETKRREEIEQQITELCGEWCKLQGKEEMDVLYLKDRVVFGEL